jgi:hypothetical protein
VHKRENWRNVWTRRSEWKEELKKCFDEKE